MALSPLRHQLLGSFNSQNTPSSNKFLWLRGELKISFVVFYGGSWWIYCLLSTRLLADILDSYLLVNSFFSISEYLVRRLIFQWLFWVSDVIWLSSGYGNLDLWWLIECRISGDLAFAVVNLWEYVVNQSNILLRTSILQTTALLSAFPLVIIVWRFMKFWSWPAHVLLRCSNLETFSRVGTFLPHRFLLPYRILRKLVLKTYIRINLVWAFCSSVLGESRGYRPQHHGTTTTQDCQRISGE